MVEIKSVALYTRVSTEDQVRDGTSLQVQEEFLRAFALRQGWQVAELYMDDGYSGYYMERPALKRLLDDAQKGKFDCVLFYKLDRFSRNLKDALNTESALAAYNVGHP